MGSILDRTKGRAPLVILPRWAVAGVFFGCLICFCLSWGVHLAATASVHPADMGEWRRVLWGAGFLAGAAVALGLAWLFGWVYCPEGGEDPGRIPRGASLVLREEGGPLASARERAWTPPARSRLRETLRGAALMAGTAAAAQLMGGPMLTTLFLVSFIGAGFIVYGPLLLARPG